MCVIAISYINTYIYFKHIKSFSTKHIWLQLLYLIRRWFGKGLTNNGITKWWKLLVLVVGAFGIRFSFYLSV